MGNNCTVIKHTYNWKVCYQEPTSSSILFINVFFALVNSAKTFFSCVYLHMSLSKELLRFSVAVKVPNVFYKCKCSYNPSKCIISFAVIAALFLMSYRF